ncbi:methylated-DNA--[protein]-cysteine S-methyltransferase [Hippea maritima]|uniref:Methylated-DNA/protein-cysteinemethyltransferase n=1 Tax=Hippea maritima (strain ATCC 700847 / DSM 10411 / MH2) TaxID=760142 RepID=F2LUQ3_HIPMA|nr:methylated-DNA--[protein]-cysteine S-methyltransferase [Hippea maritima]AEA33508.1 methylated-DNA/protein-cysteinemethyltransferase [Hippea maritima DSM 10411]
MSSKFFIDTPFDRFLVFDLNNGRIDRIFFSCQLEGQPLHGNLKRCVEYIFDSGDFSCFDYRLLNNSLISQKARMLQGFLISTKTGQTFSYSDVADKVFGSKNYARAVASMLRANPFVFFVACHRVLAKNGIGGYSAGVELKRKILKWEALKGDDYV